MKQLRELYLSKCCINDTACVSLMKNLNYHCPLLEALDLSFNKLSSSGVFEDCRSHQTHEPEMAEVAG